MKWIDINEQVPEIGQRVMCEVNIMVYGRVAEIQQVKGTYNGFEEPLGHRWDLDVDYKGRGALDFSPKVVSWMHVDDDELEPCPFCGAKAVLVNDFDSNGNEVKAVECTECFAQMAGDDLIEENAIRYWNKRVDS